MIWTEERIIEAISAWVEIRGEPPKIDDWRLAQPPHFPSSFTVVDRFGNFGNGIEAAGFRRRKTGRPSKALPTSDLLALANECGIPADIVLQKKRHENDGWWRLRMTKDALRAAPASPMRDLMWGLLTGRQFKE